MKKLIRSLIALPMVSLLATGLVVLLARWLLGSWAALPTALWCLAFFFVVGLVGCLALYWWEWRWTS